ncbi:MAG TPA: DUF3618 domain-containing protein [Solirubrobacteraceae bacterium]|nr:DUF3618 domain-containing protein [Solirubrobacteraceae bacterium]
MGEDPVAIRQDIERTREEMGETLSAIGYKTDVTARAKDKVHDRVDGVKEKLGMARDKVSDTTPSTGDAKQAARRGASIAQENPLGLAVGAAAVGFLAGMLAPATRVENEKMGAAADQVKETVSQTVSEAVDHGKQVVQEVAQETAQTAKETAQSAAQEHGQQVAESAQQNAQQTTESVRS